MYAIKSNGILTWLSRHRREFLAFLALVLALALAACDYRVDTATTVTDDLSGTRVITVAFEYPQDADTRKTTSGKLAAVPANINAALRANLPAGVEMKDFAPVGSGDKRKLVGSFTVKFSSAEDFTKKMQELRLAGLSDSSDSSARAEIEETPATLQKSVSPLVNGVTISEPYPQSDLVKWGFKTLEEANIDMPSYSSYASSSSVNALTYGKNKVQITGDEAFRLFAGSDDGARVVNVKLNLVNPKEYSALVELGVANAGEINRIEKFRSYLESVKPSAGVITTETSSEFKQMGAIKAVGLEFKAADLNQLNTELKKILGGDQDYVSIRGEEVENSSSGISATGSGYFGCINVCAAKPSKTRMTLVLPPEIMKNLQDLDDASTTDAESAVQIDQLGYYKFRFELPLSIKALNAKLTFDNPQKVRLDVDIDIPQGELEQIGLQPTTLFQPADKTAKTTIAKGAASGQTRVRVAYPSMDIAKLNQLLNKNLGISPSNAGAAKISFNVAPNGDGLLKEKRVLDVATLMYAFARNISFPEVATLEVKLPWGYHAVAAPQNSSVNVSGGTVIFTAADDGFRGRIEASATTVTAWVILGVFGGLLLIAGILLFIFRKRIAAWSNKRKEANAAKYAATAAPGAAVAAPGDVDVTMLLGGQQQAVYPVAGAPTAQQGSVATATAPAVATPVPPVTGVPAPPPPVAPSEQAQPNAPQNNTPEAWNEADFL